MFAMEELLHIEIHLEASPASPSGSQEQFLFPLKTTENISGCCHVLWMEGSFPSDFWWLDRGAMPASLLALLSQNNGKQGAGFDWGTGVGTIS